jgi:pilus assembly protein Flp/PilA
MKKVLKAFWEDEDGQTTTEYIILLAIVIAIVFKFRDSLQDKLSSLITNIFARTDDILK